MPLVEKRASGDAPPTPLELRYRALGAGRPRPVLDNKIACRVLNVSVASVGLIVTAPLMLLIAIVNVVPVAPWYMAEAEAAPEQGQRLKLLLSNVYAGNRNTQEVIDLLVAERPDVVFLQELTARRSESLAALRDSYPYSLNIPRDDNFGVAVLSQHPFASAKVVESPPFQLPSLVVELEFGEDAIAFVTTHPLPPIGKTGFDSRNEQLASIADLVNSCPGPRVLIGDLNTTMWGHHYGLLVEETGLDNVRHGFGVLPTWPTHLPFAKIPIDHCLVSEQFYVIDARTGPDIGSDHLPLIVELSLTPE